MWRKRVGTACNEVGAAATFLTLPRRLTPGLALLLLLVVASWRGHRCWRTECEVEGLNVEVGIRGFGQPRQDSDPDAPRNCVAVYLSHEDLKNGPPPSESLTNIDLIFTDSLTYVPFAGRRGSIAFIENISTFHVPDDLDGIMQTKRELLSVLMPSPRPDEWSDLAKSVFEQAQASIPDHVYMDDGTLETHESAFARYRFSLIVDDIENRSISEAFIRSMSFHTIGLFNGFVEIGAMVFNGIADFHAFPFSLPQTLVDIDRHNDHLGALWHYQRILQDQVSYRFNRPFEERLLSQACTMCRLRHLSDLSREPPLVFVGIYSARANFEKRQAVRETWGRVLLARGFRYRFFLGEPPLAGAASLEDLRVRQEIEEHGDVEFLEISEGYRMNSRKGLLFLEWIALRVEAQFLLKVDDDVYFRPVPLLEQLLGKPPAQYAWGYWDYISPVPREEDDHFYNTMEEFPFPVFPPYPRGVVRVLSMDIVRLLAKASRDGKLRMVYGDDPCIGVHLRQLLHDPEEPLPSLTIDDFDNKVFAMEPSCHPNLWSKVTNRTWVIHHVSVEQIRCMWEADVEAGYYVATPAGAIAHDESVELGAFPDLCKCAQDPSFELRTDLDTMKSETDYILYGDDGSSPASLPEGAASE